VPLRRAAAAGSEPGPTWNPAAGEIRLEPAGLLDAVVHLAGENVAQHWTFAAKARIRASRVDATQLLCVAELALQDDRLSGAVSAVSPEPITNAGFTKALARALHRPALLPVPSFAVTLLFGEMGRGALLASARVRPVRLLENGFGFRFPTLAAAFKHALSPADQTA
jgi:NAD dependent epimerase/dehydratase family enzyme